MPALPIPGPVLKCELIWTIGEDNHCANILHYAYTGSPPTSADLSTLATNMFNAFPGDYKNALHSSTQLTSVILTDLASVTGQQGLHAGNTPGSAGGFPSAASACVLQQLKVNARYRGGHPRTYWPGLDGANVADAQTWSLSSVQLLQPALMTWAKALAGQSAGGTQVTKQVIVSYYHNNALRTTPLVMDVVGWTVIGKIASQRKRLRKA